MSRRQLIWIGVIVLCAVAAVLWFNAEPAEDYVPSASANPPSPETVERGRVLTHLANCQACHTARGGEPFAGGRALASDFGTFYSPNITPDADTGIGRWTERDFWRALHL